MSIFLAIRAGRVAGKAARIYRDVMGTPPNPSLTEYLQSMAYYGDSEHELAFYALISELRKESISGQGGVEVKYMSLRDPKTRKIIATLNWLVDAKKVDPQRSSELQEMEQAIREAQG